MKMLLILASIALGFVTTSYAQTTSIGACNLATFGEKSIAPFVTFDHELREALAEPDPSKLALLVEYPLRVNDSHGSYYIQDAASLYGHFSQIFTPQIRQAVANQQLDRINCFGSGGIEYGNGDLWVDDTSNGFAVGSVNVGHVEDSPKVGRTEFACRTEKQRVLVDIGQNGLPRYRSWGRPHPLTQKADVVVQDGKEDLEGTGYCTHPVWSFAKGKTKIEVSGLGCFPDSNQPPHTATGQLSITSGKEEHWWWCY